MSETSSLPSKDQSQQGIRGHSTTGKYRMIWVKWDLNRLISQVSYKNVYILAFNAQASLMHSLQTV